jgi:hypothetical protein
VSGHDPLLEFQVGDAAFVDAGVERGGDALFDCGLVLADGLGEAGRGGKTGTCELAESVRQWGGVAGIEHGSELTDQVVASVQPTPGSARAAGGVPRLRASCGGTVWW